MTQTILDATFGGSAGVLTGTQATPINNGADVFGDFVGSGFGSIHLTGSNSASAVSIGSGEAYASYPLTSAAQDQIVTFSLINSNVRSGAAFQIHRDGPGANSLNVGLDYSGNLFHLLQTVATVTTSLVSLPVSLSTGVTTTIVLTTVGGLMSIDLNGTAIVSNQAVPTGTGTILLFGQNGTAGDVVFTEVKVQVAGGPTTATLSGPTTGTALQASSSFAVTLDAAASSAPTVVTLGDSASAGTFAGTHVSGSTLTIPAGSTSATFTYTRSTVGSSNISIVSTPLTIAGSPITFVASGLGATVTGPSSLIVGTPSSNYTVTLSAAPGGSGLTFTPSATGFAATFSPATVSIGPSATTGTFTANSTTAGTGSIGGSGTGIAVTPQSASSLFPAPTSVTLATTPNTGITGVSSSAVDVTLDTPARSGGVVVLIGETGSGDTFSTSPGGASVSSITIAQGQTSGAFYILPGPAGERDISVSSSGLTSINSPLAFTVTGQTVTTAHLTGPATGTSGSPSTFTVSLNGSSSSPTVVTLADSASAGTFGGTHVSGSTLTIPANTAFDTFTYNRGNPGTSNISISSSGLTITGSPVVYAASGTTNGEFLTSVADLFAAGLIGGTTSGFGYKVSINGGSFGSLITSGITEDVPGTYSATGTATAGALIKVLWSDGSGTTAVDTGPQFPGGANGSGGGIDPWAIVIPGTYASGTAGNMLGGYLSPTLARNVTATTLQLSTLDPLLNTDLTGGTIFVYNADTGGGQTALITSSNVTTNVQSFTAWSGGVTPTGSQIAYVIYTVGFGSGGSSNGGSDTGGTGGGPGVDLDTGFVVAAPQPPTSTTFYANGTNLLADSGGYNGMAVMFQSVGKGKVRRPIASHVRSGDLHYFVLAYAQGLPLPSPPVAGDSFVIE